MGAVQDLAEKLARALKESPEYRAFASTRQTCKGNKAAEKLLTDFRTRQYQLAVLQAQGKKPEPAQVKELETMVKALQENAVARDYLQAETRFGLLWSEVQRILAQAVGAEVPRK